MASLSVPRWALCAFYIALGLVGVASSALAIAQASFGFYPFPVWLPETAPGLFFNTTHTGAALALTALGLLAYRLYWLIPGLLPGLWLAHSRGAWAALALGILAMWVRKPLVLLALALALGVLYSFHPSSSDLQRLQIWRGAWLYLTPWGNGFDSFQYLWIGHPAWHPIYTHNDYLQTIFEFGIWSVIPFGLIAWAASRSHATAWPTLIAFLFIACFSMPLHMPIPFTIGAISLLTVLMEPLHA